MTPSGSGGGEAPKTSSAMTEDVLGHPLSAAMFESVAKRTGHYESFYLKVADPKQPRGAWVRYTAFKRPGEAPVGSLWCTVWPEDDSPVAAKLTLGAEALGRDEGEFVHIGDNRLLPGRAYGVAKEASWDLKFTQDAPLFGYERRNWTYRSPLPATNQVSLHPVSTVHGQVRLGPHELEIDGWPGMFGHNWGSKHPEEWIWLHGAGFPDAPGDWFDATMVRHRIGPVVLPWITYGCICVDGRIHRLSGPAGRTSPVVSAEPTRCEFTMRAAGATIRGSVDVSPERCIAWRYSDPAGAEHVTTNSSVAAMTLDINADGSTVTRRVPAGAAYELGSFEAPTNIPVQVPPDP